MKKRNRTVVRIIKKENTNSRLISFLYIFITVVILVSLICGVISLSNIQSIKTTINNINSRIDKTEAAISYNQTLSPDNIMLDYYRELSDKTDTAINRVLTIVGLIAGIVSFFSILLSFRAPQNLAKQINDVRKVGEKACDAAEYAQYRLEIFTAVSLDSNNNTSNVSKANMLTKLINQYPDKPDAYMMRAHIYEQLSKQFDQHCDSVRSADYCRRAISDYSVASALGADVGDCYNNIGIIYTDLLREGKESDGKEALKYYNKAIQANPQDNMFLINRGTCYEILGEYIKSLEDYNAAIKIDDTEISAYYGRSYTYRSIWKKENDPEKKNDYIRLEYDDLKIAESIDPNYLPVINRLDELIKECKVMGIELGD